MNKTSLPTKSSKRIAFLSQGGKNWIAGVIYNHNLIRALHHLPVEEQPQLDAILGPSHDVKHYQELGRLKPAVHYYCYKQQPSTRDKAYETARSLLRFRWPSSLENLMRRLKPTAVFPVHGSLGKDFPAPWIGWIPDFQHKRLPQFFSEQEQQTRNQTYEQLIKDCGHLVVSSQDALKDLMKWFPVPEKKVSVLAFTSVATPAWYQGDPQQTVAEFNLPEKFLIFPSQFWIHKNHMTVFKAILLLKNKGISDITLACTGFTSDYRRPEYFPMVQNFIEKNNLQHNIRILGLLPRDKQIHLMRASAAILQPSLFEGWSSLVEDARTLGKPIFLSDIPIHREQNPPNATYFAAENAQQLADLIAQQWKTLRSGPDLEQEKKASAEQTTRAQAFGRTFLSIVNRTAA